MHPPAESGPPPSRLTQAPLTSRGRPVGRFDLRRLRGAARLWRLYWLRIETRIVPTESQRLFALTLVIGVVSGLAAVAFHVGISTAERFLIDRALAMPGARGVVWTIITPIVGAIAAGILLQYVFPNARGSGIPQVKTAFALPGKRLRLRDSFGKFIVGMLQIGSGSSLGREGPTVQICAGIATALGRLVRVSPRSLRRLLPVGAAAGIAAAFNAPIAAVTFTIEEVVGDLDKSVLSGVIVAAALAAVLERSVLDEHPVFEIPKEYGLHHASSLLIYALLGIAAALAAVVFTDGLLIIRKRFQAMKRVPPWLQPAAGGLVTGVLAVIALHFLHVRGVTGGGYAVLSQALKGEIAVHVMLILCAMKIMATVSAYSTGGAGGIFAPALFIGGMLGGAFGWVDVQLFHHEPDTIGAFALVGMGAVFSGIIRAPMTSVLIIIEMTNGYSLIVPLMIANMSAYILARHMRPTPVYEALLEQDGIHLREKSVRDTLENIELAKVLVRDPDLVTFRPTTRAGDLAQAGTGQEVYPVVEDGVLVGLLTTEELDAIREEPDLALVVVAAEIMRAPASVTIADDVNIALEAMLANGLRRLPVLDERGQVVGMVDEDVIAKAYLRGHTRSPSRPE